MKSCVKMLLVTFFVAALIPELVLSAKKAKKLHKVYNLHRSNDSVSNAYTRIVGGTQAHRGTYPWQAALVDDDAGRDIFYGGSLIRNRWVLTAAHCVYDDNGQLRNDFLVRMGAYKAFDANFLTYGQEFTVLQTIVHNQYNRATKTHDAALLQLDGPAQQNDYVKTVKLPVAGDVAQLRQGKVCVATGFGAVDSQNTYPDYMQEVHINVATRADCAAAYPQYVIDDSMLCAGRLAGKYSTCSGDSGGPLVCRHDVVGDTSYYLHGVTSWGTVPCGEPKQYGVFADVINLLPWINANAV